MDKYVKNNLLIILACTFVILFTYLFFRKNDNKKVNQNIFPTDLSGNIDYGKRIGLWHGNKVTIPPYIFEIDDNKVLDEVVKDDRLIDVDLSDQKLTARENGKVFLESLISTGISLWPTPQGEFYIWLKVKSAKMEGGEGRYYYNLPNVPYIMYFQNEKITGSRGLSLHGTYWHDSFGTVFSHGGIDLPTSVAKEIYYWSYPVFQNSWNTVYSSEYNLGTKIVIHE